VCDRTSNNHADYSKEQKLYLNPKLLSATTKKTTIGVSTGQDWSKNLREYPDQNIYDK
jgi:hypothetical protein